MYRILVIDDEPIIADGLYELFAQDETFALEVHKVYSAPDALKLLDRLRIDIVLSDIKMPGMNGLELLTQIHRRWPFCHVIFLSGYSDFEYVQKAMQLGADSYILKSQGDEVVLETVYKTLALLEQETTSAVWNRRMEEELKNARPLLCQDFLWKMLRGEITGAQLEQQLLKLGLPLRAGHPVFLVGGRLDHMPQKSGVADSAQLLEQIHAVFMTYTLPTLNCANVCWQNRYWLWLIQPLEQNPAVVARLDSFLSGMLERVQEYCQKQLCVAVSLVTDSQPHAWQELPAAFERYRSVLTYQLGAQDEMLLGEIAFFDQAMPDHPVWDGSADALLSSLESAFEYRQKDSFDQLLQTLLQGLLACGNPIQKIELYHRLCLFFLERVAAAGRQKDFFDRFHGYAAFTMPYEQWDSSLPSLFSKMGDWLFEGIEDRHAARFHQMVYTLHQYIAVHLSEDLSVNALAEKVYLNPVYLSRAYKQATGEKLSEYILVRRLERAKQLLQQPEKKISEIGYLIGLDSAAHFSRVFKKYTGLSPQEYREASAHL